MEKTPTSKKYHLAWVSAPQSTRQIPFLGSTDTALIKWYLDELKKMDPDFLLDKRRLNPDPDGNTTLAYIEKIKTEVNINIWQLQCLLQMGWEPFSIARGIFPPYGECSFLYLRREVSE